MAHTPSDPFQTFHHHSNLTLDQPSPIPSCHPCRASDRDTAYLAGTGPKTRSRTRLRHICKHKNPSPAQGPFPKTNPRTEPSQKAKSTPRQNPSPREHPSSRNNPSQRNTPSPRQTPSPIQNPAPRRKGIPPREVISPPATTLPRPASRTRQMESQHPANQRIFA
jgi:hypothetical protein